MKSILFGLALACCATAASAQGTDYLTFRTADGAERSLLADGLKITFSDGKLTARNAAESIELPLNDLGLMFFSSTPTGIATAEADKAAAAISNGSLCVEAPAGSRVSLYTPDGRLVGSYVKGNSGAEALCGNLPAGVYIVNINGKTCKLLAR